MPATHVSDRVKKHRAKKKVTPEGIEEMRAHNRVYAKRSRAKKEVKRLTEEKIGMKKALGIHDEHDVENKTQKYKAKLLEGKRDRYYDELNDDDKRDVDIKILRYEVNAMRRILKNDLMESVGMLLHLRGSAGKQV
mmetsp:Transcript_6534/g.11855  ORF Transcript_6534/g.11855 Transcript_6534/m.11855 type:complete len:136 (+) Transcript_6534:159-566(+)|eukprot:CAMPEP_0201599858 /NCGR_PEP_ID=MMETSP0492-20130828/1149_1 /ASSEMBLY_ACC=CAM_ASM_000837 /TAXON_ID=420259 /ORGANISM="Thalassiosira gravida, Strain GMp14c1" /LENGTH=135 /DNA_ID=CAMNT_0048062511 /DNA_START=144 /DNA_END=551 /DNA_ORIENTATION=-